MLRLNSISPKRDKLSILTDMLKTAKQGAGKTRIMHSTNMNHNSVTEYLRFMLKHQLLSKNIEGKKVVYRPTEKGLTILSLYNTLVEDLEN